MTPILSILLPSRGRCDRLVQAIKSFSTAGLPEEYEFRIRLDEDDKSSTSRIEEIKSLHPSVFVTVGPRDEPKEFFVNFCTLAAKESHAPWICGWNDDTLQIGENWIQRLLDIPTEGFIIQQEIHKLNLSTYLKSQGGPFPIVPKGCWEKFGLSRIPNPIDTGLDELLRGQNRWQTKWLEGVGFHHVRIN